MSNDARSQIQGGFYRVVREQDALVLLQAETSHFDVPLVISAHLAVKFSFADGGRSGL